LPIIGKLLGHKHHDTTMHYAHLDADPLRRGTERIGIEIAAALGEWLPSSAEVLEWRRNMTADAGSRIRIRPRGAQRVHDSGVRLAAGIADEVIVRVHQ
jgi:hypothetical protein